MHKENTTDLFLRKDNAIFLKTNYLCLQSTDLNTCSLLLTPHLIQSIGHVFLKVLYHLEIKIKKII